MALFARNTHASRDHGSARARRGLGKWIAGGLAALLFGSAMVASGGGVVPATAMEGASLLLVKTVDGEQAHRDLRPGDSVVYRVEFRVNDEDADAPVAVADVLPAEFSGWQISDMTAVVGGVTAGVTLDLPGITSGPSPSGPVAGTIGSTEAERTITVGVAQPVQAGAGNTSGLGMSTRDTGVLEYTLTVPANLSPSDPILRRDLVNTATFTAKAGVNDLSTSDSAIISVDNPIAVDVEPGKSWNPASQNYQPGKSSGITITGRQASNVDASSLSLQDPADPSLAPAGAASLPDGNPFAYVDFAGFTADPTDPSTFPAGATSAKIEVYRLSGGAWNWVDWDASIPNDQIAGVRAAYTGTIPPNATAAVSFDVKQRATQRSTGASISAGYAVSNTVRAKVEVPGQPAVEKTATAPFAVTPEQIDVSALKRFYTLPSGAETQNLTGVTAGDSVGVVVRAINAAAPQSTTLDSLTLSEPGTGADSQFLGADLSFGGFDMSTPEKIAAVWPAGAQGAVLTWHHGGGSAPVSLNFGDPLPAPPAGQTVTGFDIVFSGEIAPGSASEIRYQLDTSSDEGFVAAGQPAGPFKNTIDVVGEKENLPADEATADARISLVAPSITVTIDKRVGPGVVLPGQNVVVQLDTTAQATGGRTKPTEIVVEDAYDAADPANFWNAFDAKKILPPVNRPTGSDLKIEYRDAAGDWVQLGALNPAEGAEIPVPAGATGLRFVYTSIDPAGLSQTTNVKPNIEFAARTTLRSDASQPTGGEYLELKRYENVATADATGKLDTRVVTGHDDDRVDVGVRGTENSTGPGPEGLWADKDWAHSNLTSQSAATSWTTQSWSVTGHGYETVQLQDPASTSPTGAGTVFEAFNLTHIRPIRTSGSAGDGTVDPQLRWDDVTDVLLLNGETGAWEPAGPSGSWMNADGSGFKGYTLTAAEQARTIGVRLVLAENSEARRLAAAAGDLTAPAVDSGVSASAEIRSFRLDWQLRERARTADGSLKWVKSADTPFNCSPAVDGCVNNVFRLTGIEPGGASASVTAADTIQLVDGTTNVDLVKQVRPLPISADRPAADSVELVAPTYEDGIPQADYPRARYTLTAKNSSTAEPGSRGMMKLAQLRVTDTSTDQGRVPSHDIATSPFTGRDFQLETESIEGNHFDQFTLTGVSFGTLPGYIDTTWSTVEVWLFDGTPEGATQTFTLQQVLANDAAFTAVLPNVIGIAVTYSGTDPAQNGNRIVVGDNLVMNLDVQLRKTERWSGDPVRGGTHDSVVSVPNVALARGWDAVVAPDSQQVDRAEAGVDLVASGIDVNLAKAVSVDHGASSNQTVYETDPQAPVRVVLTADPGTSTAPLNTLTISDDTASFWDRFELVSFGTPTMANPTMPTDADRYAYKVRVGGTWQDFAAYTGDLAAIEGVGVVFDRADAGVFPQGTTSWSGASWNTATLPFTVKLRADATVDWASDAEVNLAGVLANNVNFPSATDQADDEVLFSPGVHQLRVVKRAPNDTSTHQVDPLASLPWKLVFTNTGSSYLPITQVTDMLPATLDWDGEDPIVTVTPGPSGVSGLSTTPTVTPPSQGDRDLVFEWPAGSRMGPGETVEIGLGLIMQPMASGQRAVNEVVVETGVPLALCEQPTDFGQAPNAPAAANECSNTNYVQPRAGTVVGARKTVSGEVVDTLGEDLVGGALDVRTLEECKPGNFLPVGSDYTRNPCASYTAVGATDTWKLENINSGSNPLARMTVVDMLPNPGDQMLAGGAPRTSTFRPVLADTSSIRLSGAPAGASYTVEVTVNPTACIGPNPGASLWVSDPECSDTTANPANVWTPLASYTGDIEDIVGLRFQIDMTAQPLQPAGNVVIEFETVNRVVDAADEGLHPTLDQFATRQFAWNQQGVTAWNTAGAQVNLPAAPQRAGVTVKTGSLVVSKAVAGDGADNAPASFPVELSCTVPSGVADPARVPLDLGASANLTVPKNGSVTVAGIPIGADCVAQESGAVGDHGESGRSIEATDGVTPSTDGLSAEIRIRERGADDATLLNLTNTYTLGELVVEKSLLTGNGYELDKDQKRTVFEFELVCDVNGMNDPIQRSFTLKGGEQHREATLPVGARCTLTETKTGGAQKTTVTVAGDETVGTGRDQLLITDQGLHVLVSNVFDGPTPKSLSLTGAGAAGLIAMGILLIGLGAAVLAMRRRRESAE